MDKILRTKDLCKYYGSGENEVRAVQNANIRRQAGKCLSVEKTFFPIRTMR